MSFWFGFLASVLVFLPPGAQGSCSGEITGDRQEIISNGGSHVGHYHNFNIDCVNNTFAMLSVKETGKYYSSVTIEMTCTNELLNTTNMRTLKLKYNYIDGDIPVHYDLRPGTVCIFYGCVKASRKGYMYNNEEASCRRDPEAMTTSSINTEGTSSVLSYTNSVFTTTTEMSSTVIVMKSIESFTSSSDYPLSSSTTGSSSTDLPTVPSQLPSSDSFLSSSVLSVLGAVVLVVTSIILFFVVVLCCFHSAHKRKAVNDIDFIVDLEMEKDDIHRFMLDDISIAESVTTIVQSLYPPVLPSTKHCSLILSTPAPDIRNGSVSVHEVVVKEVQIEPSCTGAEPITKDTRNSNDANAFLDISESPPSLPSSSLHISDTANNRLGSYPVTNGIYPSGRGLHSAAQRNADFTPDTNTLTTSTAAVSGVGCLQTVGGYHIQPLAIHVGTSSSNTGHTHDSLLDPASQSRGIGSACMKCHPQANANGYLLNQQFSGPVARAECSSAFAQLSTTFTTTSSIKECSSSYGVTKNGCVYSNDSPASKSSTTNINPDRSNGYVSSGDCMQQSSKSLLASSTDACSKGYNEFEDSRMLSRDSTRYDSDYISGSEGVLDSSCSSSQVGGIFQTGSRPLVQLSVSSIYSSDPELPPSPDYVQKPLLTEMHN